MNTWQQILDEFNRRRMEIMNNVDDPNRSQLADYIDLHNWLLQAMLEKLRDEDKRP